MIYQYYFREQRRLAVGPGDARHRLDLPISATLYARMQALRLDEQPRVLTVLREALDLAMDAWDEAAREEPQEPLVTAPHAAAGTGCADRGTYRLEAWPEGSPEPLEEQGV